MTGRAVCAGPIARRSLLQAGALAFSGLGLGDVLRLRAAAAADSGQQERDTAVIFLWLPGGPPHMETFDMKPDAPEDYRGAYRPISTNVPGIEICELMPELARRADKYTLIRSIAHKFADHGGGHKRFMTARDPKEPTGFVNDYPAVASMIAALRNPMKRGVPSYVMGVDNGRQGIDVFSVGTAYLGPAHGPFFVVGDPSAADFKVQNLSLSAAMETQLDDRKQLLTGLDRMRRDIDASGAAAAMDQFNRRALDLLTSKEARDAFDLSQEPAELREKYGNHAWGQRALMARRLVEAGATFVTMVLENPYTSGMPRLKSGVYNWDSHAVNCHIFEDGRVRIPLLDKVVAALVDDIYSRGLDKKVMVVVTGEFGRTPRVSHQIGTQTGVMQPGRDHWPQAMSVLAFGGGMRTGQVVGSTNSKGEHPQERPLTPNDLWATMLHHLGVNQNHNFLDLSGRPMPLLPYGEPIAELL